MVFYKLVVDPAATGAPQIARGQWTSVNFKLANLAASIFGGSQYRWPFGTYRPEVCVDVISTFLCILLSAPDAFFPGSLHNTQ